MTRVVALRAIALAVALSSVIGSAAQAGLVITLHETGFTDKVITDNSAGDGSAALGSIFYGGPFGDFSLTLNIAASNALTLATPATLNVVDMVSSGVFSGSKTLVVTVSDDSFITPASFAGGSLGLVSVGSNSGSFGTMSFQSYLNSYTTGLQGPLAVGQSDTATITHIPGTVTAPYTVTSVTAITLASGQSISTSGSTSVVVPEPASLAVWGLGVSCVGLVSLVRRRRCAGVDR